MRIRVAAVVLSLTVLAACGEGPAPLRAPLSARQALTGSPELLQLESATVRQELFRELARISEQEAGQSAQALVLFPVSRDDRFVAAPGFDARLDLLQAPDAGGGLTLGFEGRAGERWPEDRSESLQGLSEREAAELVARTLLARWDVHPAGRVQVDRAAGAPYAAAYVDGILRINPSFLYLAAAFGPASTPASAQ
ncbi:hypothetical protein FGE12_18995 [Aggregicoccus sp. 17bor-14]|uniref:hypothetical protein n=1 Tax=Myxococcaceae TaxID=31 RepID=UPI00129C1FE3|nr:MULTISPECIES: hypothetical protein [Myxococcaceae]MBF5044494.1 hypothetical protein [Simulacricoccus sp. 17bor-14]MRI90239.1 hypothetical protein [Aggregicoccus sp. 17bor-14]